VLSRHRDFHSFPTRRSSDLFVINGLSDGYFRNHPMFLPQSDFIVRFDQELAVDFLGKFEEIDESFGEIARKLNLDIKLPKINMRSEEHTSELQSRENLVCRL